MSVDSWVCVIARTRRQFLDFCRREEIEPSGFSRKDRLAQELGEAVRYFFYEDQGHYSRLRRRTVKIIRTGDWWERKDASFFEEQILNWRTDLRAWPTIEDYQL